MQHLWSDRIIHYLAGLPIFKDLAVEELPLLLNWLGVTIKSYNAGAVIYRRGDKIQQIYIPMQKNFSLGIWPWLDDKSKNLLFPNCLGLIEDFMCGSIATHDLIIDHALDFVVIPWQVVKWRLASTGSLAWTIQLFLYNIADINFNLLRLVNYHNEILKLISMRAKLAKYLMINRNLTGSNQFTLHINRQELADFLMVSRPTMCRELTKMQKDGLIRYYLNDFTLLETDYLSFIAEKNTR